MQKTVNFFYAFLLAILGFGVTLMAEDITLTTYYPAPYGTYDELTTTGNTYLATTSGNVGIGTTSSSQNLTVNGSCLVTGKFSGGIQGNSGAVSSPGAIAFNTYTINFGVTFSSAPRIIVAPRTNTVNPGLLVVNIESVGVSSFVIRVSDNDYGRAGVSGTVDWVAFGN